MRKTRLLFKYSDSQARDSNGRFAGGGESGASVEAKLNAMFADNLGHARATMPQVPSGLKAKFLDELTASGVSSEAQSVDASALKATQKDFKTSNVEHLQGVGPNAGTPILVSREGRVLDGHHRWAAAALNGEKIDTIRVHLPISDLLDRAQAFNDANGVERRTTKIRKYDENQPRAENGQFGSGDSSSKLHEGVAAIKAMTQDERDNLEPGNAPGGYQAYQLYEAQKSLPKPSEKLKRVTESNSFTLHQEQDYIANVDGTHFGVTKIDDPDAKEGNVDDDGNAKEFVYAYVRLDHPDAKPGVTDNADIKDLFAAMRAYKPTTAKLVSLGALIKYSENQPRDSNGRFAGGGGSDAGGPKATLSSISIRSEEQILLGDTLHAEAHQMVAGMMAPGVNPVRALSAEEKAGAVKDLAASLKAAEAAKPAYDEKVRAIGKEFGAQVMLAPIKGGERLLQKHIDENGSDHSKMRDLVRGSIIVNKAEDAPAALEALSKSFEITRVKDRFSSPLSTGYRDILANVRLPGGIEGEVQIHIPEMITAKGGVGHKLYDIQRALPAGHEDIPKLEAMQTRVYGAAYAANGRRK